MACWRGAPRPTCGGFFVVEMQGVMPLVQSRWGRGTSGVQAFESQLEWNLGYMGNAGTRWAFGSTISIGTGANGALTGLRARARRWLGPQQSLELEAGTFFTQALFNPGDLTGLTAGVRFNLGDRGSLFVRWDGVDVPAASFPANSELRIVGAAPGDGSRSGIANQPPGETGGFRQAIHVGVGTGSTWAVATTAALGVGYLVLMAILLNSGYS